MLLTFRVELSSKTPPSRPPLTYNGVTALNLNAGAGSDVFAIDSSSASTSDS